MSSLPLLTLTGIDANTDPKWVHESIKGFIHNSGYSALEFGILRSPKVHQSPRYPGRESIKTLLSAGKCGDFAFHLCGEYARMALDEARWEELCDIMDFDRVGRVQVNGVVKDAMVLWRFSKYINRPVIMQWREPVFPALPAGLHLLQDNSGGKGKVEETWASPEPLCVTVGTPTGYAGGLGPGNMSFQANRIKLATKGKKFWLDCESSLRSTEDWFMTSKADQMIREVRKAFPDLLQALKESQ